MDNRITDLTALLNKHGFTAYAVNDTTEAMSIVSDLISDAKSVGMGGSTTLYRSGIWAMIANDDTKKFYNSVYAVKNKLDVPTAMKMGMEADVYISSANAITMSGSIINIDGTGNRCAATFYGPDRVIFVIGKNKIAENYESAIERIKSVSCPNNAKRLKKATPCAVTGKCGDCNTSERMCNVTVIMDRPTRDKEVHVILVDMDLGD